MKFWLNFHKMKLHHLINGSSQVYEPCPIEYDNNKTAAKINTIERLILFLIPLATGLYALCLGQDTNWDLQNYHFYNPFAYLTDRMGHDIAVSFSVTYYNPVLHIPFYYAVTSLPPKSVGFLLGVFQGLNTLPLYGIVRQAMDFKNNRKANWFCLSIALMGMLCSNFLSDIGSSFVDNFLSIPLLTGVWLLLKFRERLNASLRAGWPVAATAGALTGAAFGLKLPFGLYAVGICATFLGLAMPFRRRFILAFIFGLGVLAGLALTNGFWMLEMWERFQNPIFPHFNQYFKSPWADASCHCDDNFIPKNFSMWLFFPFWFTADPLLVGELPFRDLRFPLLYLLSAALLIKWVYGRFNRLQAELPATGRDYEQIPATAFIAIFMLVSFALWMKVFSIYRYLIICEMLAPLSMALGLKTLMPNGRRWMQATVACFLLLIITLQPTDWGRRPWAADYFGVHLPALSEPDNKIILLTGYEPMAYMIPFFPQQVRFLRIQRYFEIFPNETDHLMHSIVDAHNGKLFTIYRSYEKDSALQALKEYRLKLDSSSCISFLPGIDLQTEEPYYFCGVEKYRDK